MAGSEVSAAWVEEASRQQCTIVVSRRPRQPGVPIDIIAHGGAFDMTAGDTGSTVPDAVGALQAARVASSMEATTSTPFQEMSAGTARKYVMVSGKGGVGKTSLAASLAVQFAADGHNTLVVSTDPAHSLSDSLDQVHYSYQPHAAQ